MKKLLLAGTAIAGLAVMPSAAHAEIDLDVGGYFKGYLGYVDQDNDSGLHDFDWKRESEIHFKGETTLDNGLTVGVNFEIEAENQSTGTEETVEESYVYFSGNWGRVNLGAEDGAAYLLQVAAPSADDNVDGMDPDIRFVNAPTGASFDAEFAYEQSFTQDADKITYLTPKFNGFQAGVSYKPSDVEDGSATIGSSLAGMNSDADTGLQYQDLIEGAFRYDGEFEGVGVAFGAGYTTADQDVSEAGEDDYEEYNVGLTLSFDAFSLGAVYTEDNNGMDDTDDDEIWVIGADYTYGPYKFGASYMNSTNEETTGEDELDRYSIGAQYVYGPGMSFRGSVNVYDMDGDGSTAGEDRDAVSVLVGTDISF